MKYRLVSRRTHTIHPYQADSLADSLILLGVLSILSVLGVMGFQFICKVLG